MERKQLLAGLGVGALIAGAVFAAGGVKPDSSASAALGATQYNAGSAGIAQAPAQSRPAAAYNQPARANLAVQPQAYGQAGRRSPAAQATATAEPTEVADTPEPTEVAGTPEPTEVAGTPEPTEVAGQDGDKIEQGDTSEPDTDSDAEQGDTKGAAEPEDNEAADAQALAAQARITQQQAEKVALAAHPGATVAKTDLGDENGTVVYEVELNNGNDVTVNAITGAILSTDTPEQDGAEH